MAATYHLLGYYLGPTVIGFQPVHLLLLLSIPHLVYSQKNSQIILIIVLKPSPLAPVSKQKLKLTRFHPLLLIYSISLLSKHQLLCPQYCGTSVVLSGRNVFSPHSKCISLVQIFDLFPSFAKGPFLIVYDICNPSTCYFTLLISYFVIFQSFHHLLFCIFFL